MSKNIALGITISLVLITLNMSFVTTIRESDEHLFMENIGIADAPTPSSRALDWTHWARSPISVDGNVSDWVDNYTPTQIGRQGQDVKLYMANNDTYLYVCIDVISDPDDEGSASDYIQLWIDGDNDDSVVSPIQSMTNESTTDNWIRLCGNRSARSNFENIYNDAGWLNTGGGIYGDPGVYVSMWYDASNPYLQNRFVDYLYFVGHNGTPAHMVYEIGIPLDRWNWTGGDEIGACLLVFEHGDQNAIGIWPQGFARNDVSSWKDFFLATPNQLPVYSNPIATPSIIVNDNKNTTLLTIEANDPDGNITSAVIDLSTIGGASETEMVDDGTNGDAMENDGIYSCEISIPTIITPDVYNLSFTITDNHTPNIGMTVGVITLGVNQANRQPMVQMNAVDRITLKEDQLPAYINLSQVFYDLDEGDVLVYFMKNNTTWESQYDTDLAEYRILINDSIRIAPRPDGFGSEFISVKAKDSGGLNSGFPHNIQIIVQAVNDPPELTSVNGTDILTDTIFLEAPEDVWSSFIFRAEDIDDGSLTYSVNISDELPDMRKDKEYVFHNDNGTLKIKPLNHHVGSYNLLVSVDDGNGGEDAIEVNLSVKNTNDPPNLDRIGDRYVDQDQWLEIDPLANDDDIPYGDLLSFHTNLTNEIQVPLTEKNFLFDNDTGKLRFRPDKNMVNTYHTHIEVVDLAREKHRRDFKITVVDVNDPPENPNFNYSSDRANLTVTFAAEPCFDPDNDTLTYLWDFGDGSSNKLGVELYNVSHKYEKEGNYTVTLQVSDGNDNGTVECSMEVTVESPGNEGSDPWNGGSGDGYYEFSGKIEDKERNGVENAVIRIHNLDYPETDMVINSDFGGNFNSHLPPGNYRVTVTSTGFQDYEFPLEIGNTDYHSRIPLTRIGENNGDKSDEKKSRDSVDLWLWLIVGSLLTLIIIGMVMVIVFKKRSRREKKTELAEPALELLHRAAEPNTGLETHHVSPGSSHSPADGTATPNDRVMAQSYTIASLPPLAPESPTGSNQEEVSKSLEDRKEAESSKLMVTGSEPIQPKDAQVDTSVPEHYYRAPGEKANLAQTEVRSPETGMRAGGSGAPVPPAPPPPPLSEEDRRKAIDNILTLINKRDEDMKN